MSRLRGIRAVFVREFGTMFLSPVALVFLVLFLLLAGFFTFMAGGFFETGQANLDAFFVWHPWLYLFFAPAIGMRLWSAERQSGTLELLFTMPVLPGDAAIAKFLAAWAMTALALALTFPVVLTVHYLGTPDNGVIAAGYAGSLLMAGACVAIASASSACTRHTVAAFLPAVAVILFLNLAGWPPVTRLLSTYLDAGTVDFVAGISLITHFESLRRGVLDTRDILYFLSLIVLGVFATRVFLRPAGGVSRINSPAALALLAVVLLALNGIAGLRPIRFDITEDRSFTLDAGTIEVLKDLSAPVDVRLYVSSGKEMPSFLKLHAKRVEELLREFEQVSGGRLRVRVLFPEPDSPAEDSARLDGLSQQLLSNGAKVWLGVSFRMLDRTRTIPFLAPARERLLEYDLIDAIASIATEKPRVVGILSPLNLGGSMMGFGFLEPEWILHSELRNRFDLRTLPFDVKEIPNEIEALLVVHPRNLPENTARAIDVFMRRGGRLLAFLDPLSPFDNKGPVGMFVAPQSSNLEPLLSAWGIQFTADKIVADPLLATDTVRGRHPAILSLDEETLNREDPATIDSDNATLVFSGCFEGKPAPGLEERVLLRSSPRAVLVDPFEAQGNGESLLTKFQAGSGAQRALAIRLTGVFPPAFDKENNPSEGAVGAAILFGDSDFLRDEVAVREIALPGGGRIFVPSNGNLPIVEAALENLLGDTRLIALRGRSTRDRPFTVIKAMQARAEDAFREKLEKLERELAETEKRLNELQEPVQSGQPIVLSEQQQKELAQFRATEARVRAEIREVRRNLRAEIERLQTTLTWLNIGAVPAAILVIALVTAFTKSLRRRKRSK